jgi:hypothetical protein
MAGRGGEEEWQSNAPSRWQSPCSFNHQNHMHSICKQSSVTAGVY